MMKREFKGQTVEDAVRAAAEAFGVSVSEIEYEVTQLPKDAFLGIFGKKEAAILASVKEQPAAPAVEAEPVVEAAPVVADAPAEEPAEEPVVAEEPAEEAAPAVAEEPAEENLGVFGVFDAPAAPAEESMTGVFEAEEEPAEAVEESSSCEEASEEEAVESASEESASFEADADEIGSPAEEAEEERRVRYGIVVSAEEAEARAKTFLEGLLEHMDIEGEVVCEMKEERLEVRISGAKMGVLIGHRGETLDAVQYLTSLVVNKKNDEYIKVSVDTENYRRKREETLKSLARRLAYKCAKTRRSVVLEPMNANERRIIHSELQNFRNVKTHSEGEEPYRKVVISYEYKN